MKSGHIIKSPSRPILGSLLLTIGLLLGASPAYALKSDRQQPLEVKADATDGTLGDGTATLRGNVEIRQGTLLIRADVARVERVEGRVRRFELDGNPVHLQQEIEQEGLVSAEARNVDYEVASGIVTLTGAADVDHPQYHISGEVLRYDLNAQHFQGSGGEADGRIRIRMDPEVIPGETTPETTPENPSEDAPETPAAESDGQD
jgi:lipopolysaccharide export system protein LptA